ncbi:MAG: GntR family transcriptional regulator, partial [Nocardioidaceae bacterium]|nr:GntR family transcriptional regulator [Nocardioidaceae bacterium]
ASLLRERIATGELAAGSRLDESALAADCSASRNTVREALGLLRRDGLVERRRGVGTTVLAPKYGHGLDRLAGLSEALGGYGSVRNRVLLAETVREVPPEVAAQLRIDTAAGAVHLRRLRLLNGTPLSLDLSYLPSDIGIPLLDEDLENTDVFALIEKTAGVPLGSADVTVHAADADPEVAGLLGVRPHTAIFTIERVTRLADGRPVDAEVLHVRADRFTLQTTIHREPHASTP